MLLISNSNQRTFFCLLTILLMVNYTHDTTFQQFKKQMENVVKQIALKMEQHYTGWCSSGVAMCQTLSVNACFGTTQKFCDLKFPKPVVCFNPGQFVSNSSNIKFPPNINYNNLTEEEMRFVCSSAKLQTTFHNLSNNRNNKFTSMYFGNKRGIFRQFPGNYHGVNDQECDEYDPRYRPWYTIAASGAKNVIILLDKSRSMQDNNQFKIAKNAVKSVLETLSISDNVGLITFENTTQNIGSEKLEKATNEYKESLINQIQEIKSYYGETNFWAAFQTGLNMVKNGIDSGVSGCIQAQNVFLLVTDGNPTQDVTSATMLIKKIQNFTANNLKKSIEIFTYALGKETNIDFLKTLACSFKGIVISQSDSGVIGDSDSAIVTKLSDFYAYLAVGVKLTSPVWTEPYTDYYGYGKMVTVSMPAYQTNPETNISGLIGVAGVDIIMSRFDEYGLSESDVTIQLIGESACQKNYLQNCEVEALRSEKYRCNIENCPNINTRNKKCGIIPKTRQIYSKQQLIKNENRCCGITLNEFIISCVFGFLSFVLFILFLWKRKQIIRLFNKRKYRKIDSNSLSHTSLKSVRKQSLQVPDTTKNLYIINDHYKPEDQRFEVL